MVSSIVVEVCVFCVTVGTVVTRGQFLARSRTNAAIAEVKFEATEVVTVPLLGERGWSDLNVTTSVAVATEVKPQVAALNDQPVYFH